MKKPDFFDLRDESYNQRLEGYLGEFGEGRDVRICYLQTGIQPSELGKLALISELAGSEKWQVRDLFQREVDRYRVEKYIIPYIEDRDKVKFFPPLTLTLLPVQDQGATVLTNLQYVAPIELELDGHTWVAYEMPGYYRFRHIKERPCYGIVEWCDRKVRVVAIDGQHRLSALKRIVQKAADDPARKELLKWTIPVVAFGLRALSKNVKGSILNHIRSIFICINTTARLPNRARSILLSDESITAICTQELLQAAHENDCKEAGKRDASKVPLLFYDWRGEEEGGKRKYSPSYIKPIEEVEDWFKYYFTGEDFSDCQKARLGIDPTHRLQSVYQKKMLEPADSDIVRGEFRRLMLDGIEHLLANFVPYKEYMDTLRKIETSYLRKSDVAQHAFYQLRFGVHNITDPGLIRDIAKVYEEIVQEIVVAKQKLPDVVAHDIGFRGVAYAFGTLKQCYDSDRRKPSGWYDYACWFTEGLNLAYGDHWLDGEDRAKQQLLKHVTYDHNDTVVHYRLDAVPDGLGSLVALLVAHYGGGSLSVKKRVSDECMENLKETLEWGYHRECYAELKIQHPAWTRKKVSDAARKKAGPRVKKHVDRLEQMIRVIGRAGAREKPRRMAKGK